MNIYDIVTDRVIISPEGKSLTISEMEGVFDRAGAVTETIFRRLEFNQVIQFTKGVGIDIGCGLNKIHSAAIGIDFRLGDKDSGYPFSANIKVPKNKAGCHYLGFATSHCISCFPATAWNIFLEPGEAIREIFRPLKPGGYPALILPDMR